MPPFVQRAYIATYCHYRHRRWLHADAVDEARMHLARLGAVAVVLAPLLPASFIANVILGGIDLRAYQTADVYLVAILGVFELIDVIRQRLAPNRLPALDRADFDAARVARGRWAYWRFTGVYLTALMGWILAAMLLQLAA